MKYNYAIKAEMETTMEIPTGFLSSILSFPQIPICRPHFLLDKRENHDFFLFKKLIVLFTINITHINPTTPQMMVSFKSAKPPVYRIA